MANKNTRKLRKNIRAACKRGETTVVHKTPVKDYHNWSNNDYRSNPDHLMITQSFPTALVGKGGIVSQNRKRNTCMRVLTNTNENRKTANLTVHEPLAKGEPVTHKAHKYMAGQYRQPHIKTKQSVGTIPTTAIVAASK